MLIGKFQGVIATHDAARLAEGHHPLARVLDRDRVAGQPPGLGGRQPEAAGRRGDLAEGLGERLAVLEDEVGGDLVAAAVDDVGDPLHLARPLERRPPAVPFERLARLRDGPVDVGRPGRGDLGDRFARRGAGEDGGLARRGIDHCAADEEPMTPGPHRGQGGHGSLPVGVGVGGLADPRCAWHHA